MWSDDLSPQYLETIVAGRLDKVKQPPSFAQVVSGPVRVHDQWMRMVAPLSSPILRGAKCSNTDLVASTPFSAQVAHLSTAWAFTFLPL